MTKINLRSFVSRIRGQEALIFFIVLALLIRIPVALFMSDQIEPLPGIHDQISYDALAKNIIAGKGYSFEENWYPFTKAYTPTAHWSFIYPLYLALVYQLIGYHPLGARLIQGIIGSISICLLIYLIGRRLFNNRTAVISAILAAFYGYFIYYNVALMTETFFIVATLLSIYLCLEIRINPSFAKWLFLGFSLGIAILLRQTALLLIPVFILWLYLTLRENIRLWHMVIPVLPLVLLIIPWTIRNYLIYGHFLLLNSNSGYALFASNHPNLGTIWDNDKVVVPIPTELIGLNEAELDRALQIRAFQFVFDDPVRYFRLVISKSLEQFKFWPLRESSTMSNVVRVFSFGLYLPFMVWGLYMSFSDWRKYLLLYVFIISLTVIHLLSWPSPRYRLPVDAVMMLFAGYAVNDLFERIQYLTLASKRSISE